MGGSGLTLTSEPNTNKKMRVNERQISIIKTVGVSRHLLQEGCIRSYSSTAAVALYSWSALCRCPCYTEQWTVSQPCTP